MLLKDIHTGTQQTLGWGPLK